MPARLKVVLYWHMHQPEYQVQPHGEYQLPWTYLHAMKDYTDMAAHIETNPQAKAVVNFAPTLLEQIRDYAEQIRSFQQQGTAIRDPLLAVLANPVLPADPLIRLSIVKNCLRANEVRMVRRFGGTTRSGLGHPDRIEGRARRADGDLGTRARAGR